MQVVCIIQHGLLTIRYLRGTSMYVKRPIHPDVSKFAHIPTGMMRVEYRKDGKYKGNVSTVNNSCRRTPLTMPLYRPQGHFTVGRRRKVCSFPDKLSAVIP